MRCLRFIIVTTLPLLAACGESGSNPCKPAEVNFSARGPNNAPFLVYGFDTENGSHHHTLNPPNTPLGTPTELIGPHTFYLINVVPPVKGTFQASPNAFEDVPVVLRNPSLLSLGSVTLSPNSPSMFLMTSGSPDKAGCLAPQSAHDIRVEAFAKSGAFDVHFTMNLGGQGESFLACGVNPAVCGTPSTVIFDNAQHSFNAIITKSVNDGEPIELQLFVNGSLSDSDEATDDDHTAKVRVDF